MVVWIIAGGGKSEFIGIQPFFKKNYSKLGYSFQRLSPTAIKGPKPKPQGHTDNSLAKEIVRILKTKSRKNETCDLILVIDDLDCKDVATQRQVFQTAIDETPSFQTVSRYVGFAVPEIESWIIAEWNNTLAKDSDFRQHHSAMRHWLSTQKGVKFDDPESFSEYDSAKKSCKEKLSEALIESSMELWKQGIECVEYSKGHHTGEFLKTLSAQGISQKCKHFREMHNFLQEYPSGQ